MVTWASCSCRPVHRHLGSAALSEELARNFIGGYGIGAKILYDEMPAHTDVFAPESMLGFMSGPMSASRAFFGGRYMVVSKSPVTGMWNDATPALFRRPAAPFRL